MSAEREKKRDRRRGMDGGNQRKGTDRNRQVNVDEERELKTHDYIQCKMVYSLMSITLSHCGI